jgi:hypothetical protein
MSEQWPPGGAQQTGHRRPDSPELRAELAQLAAFRRVTFGDDEIAETICMHLVMAADWPDPDARTYAAQITAEATSWPTGQLLDNFRAYQQASRERARLNGAAKHYVPGMDLPQHLEFMRPQLESGFDSDVAAKARSRAIDEQAQRQLDAQGWRKPTIEEFPGTLADSLKLPRRPQRYLIEPMWGAAHVVSIEALFKTGKTTLVGSALGSLADGTPFLGFAPVHPPAGPVAVWNCEMDREEFDDLYLAPYVRDHTRVIPAHLRYKPMPVLASRAAREDTVAWLRYYGVAVWVIDTWTRLCAWNGIDPAANAGVAALAACVDEIRGEAGTGSLGVTSHMPHAARTDRAFERGFGAQAFSGWVDVMWRYTSNDAGERFLAASGRKVSLNEFKVLMTPEGALYGQQGDRRSAAADTSMAEAIVAMHIQRHPGQTRNEIETALKAHGRNKIRQALAEAVSEGWVTVRPGPRKSFLHYPAGM